MSVAEKPRLAIRPGTEVNTGQRLLMGCLGALTPLVLNLAVIDCETLTGVTPLVAFAYAIRIAALSFMGAMVAYLHKDERQAVKLFELGIIAPALLTSLMNGANLRREKTSIELANRPAAFFQLVPSVHAQSKASTNQQMKSFKLPPETAGEQFLRGLTGTTSARVWFVIVGSYTDLTVAERQAQLVGNRLGTRAEIYQPYSRGGQYPIVIGAQMTKADAEKLRSRAEKSGFASTYIWTLPSK